jgi:hypothetical protein
VGRLGGACYHAGVGTSRTFTALALACVLAGLGCFAWNPWQPDQAPPDPSSIAPSRAIRLRPPASEAGDLDCKGDQRCQQWFRVDVDRAGVLRVEAGLSGLADNALARLVLQDGVGASIANASSRDGLPLWVRAPVVPGPYAVLLQAGGGAVVWSLAAEME